MNVKMKRPGNCILDYFIQTQPQTGQGLTRRADTSETGLTLRFKIKKLQFHPLDGLHENQALWSYKGKSLLGFENIPLPLWLSRHQIPSFQMFPHPLAVVH